MARNASPGCGTTAELVLRIRQVDFAGMLDLVAVRGLPTQTVVVLAVWEIIAISENCGDSETGFSYLGAFMHIRSRAAILLGTTILAGSAWGVAQAQTATAASSIETVTVTAEKRAESAQNVPMGISVVGEDQLNKLNIRSFEDLMNQVPGLSVSEADPTHPVLILRGINAGGDGSTVGTYLDETPYGSSNALANGTDTAPDLDTFDMNRVEVLRGPQGTVYGAARKAVLSNS